MSKHHTRAEYWRPRNEETRQILMRKLSRVTMRFWKYVLKFKAHEQAFLFIKFVKKKHLQIEIFFQQPIFQSRGGMNGTHFEGGNEQPTQASIR